MSIKIINGIEFDPKESITMIVYGATKSGKTQLGGTFGDRTLYINIGAGIATLYGPKFENMNGKWDGILVTAKEDDPFKPQLFDDVCETLDDYLNDAEKQKTFDSIIIDDATQLSESCMNKGLHWGEMLGTSHSKAKSVQVGVAMAEVQDYKAEMNLMDQFMKEYTQTCKAKGKNFIVLAHEQADYGKAPGIGLPQPIIRIRPSFTGKKNNLTSYFDNVWYMTAEGGGDKIRYIARTTRDELIEAGTRLGGIFPERYFNPNYEEIKNALEYYHTNGKIAPIGMFFNRPK